MLEGIAVLSTTLPGMPIPGVDAPYPWGSSGADEIMAIAIWDLGRRWLARHYDSEREQYVDALQSE